MKTYRYRLTAGALIRRVVRRQLLAAGFTFTEEKGLLDSLFVVTGLTASQFQALHAYVTRVNAS